MRQVVNIGSLNIDDVFAVDHFVAPGETLSTLDYRREVGGKGLNQSVALSRAGARVSHIGCIGNDGSFLKDFLRESGVDVTHVNVVNTPTGRAVIQVCQGQQNHGENSIILFGGANHAVQDEMIRQTLQQFHRDDILLLQNETSGLKTAMEVAHQLGINLAFNPAPCSAELLTSLPLHLLQFLVLNEDETYKLCNETDPAKALPALRKISPEALICITLGGQGSIMFEKSGRQTIQPALKVDVVNTTAAGDTFIGYLLAGISVGRDPVLCLREAAVASGICVSRQGAAASIPTRKEMLEYAKAHGIPV